MIKMSTAPVNHSPRTTAIPPPSTKKIAARNAAPQAIRIANIATTPQRAGANLGGAPHDGQTRSGPSYPLPQRTQIGISLRSSNEKEISHGRVSWQTRYTYFDLGRLASSIA